MRRPGRDPSVPAGHDGASRRERLLTLVLRPTAPPLGWGIATAVLLIAAELLVVRLLGRIAPDSAFGAVLLFAVLVVSAGWGFRLAVATSAASVVAYAWVHVDDNSESLVPAVVVFSTLALLTNVLVGQSRLRAAESDQRRREADLLAELARTLLRESSSPATLETVSARLAAVLELPDAVLGPAEQPVPPGRQRIELRDGDRAAGSLLVPAGLPAAQLRRVRRVVPSLEALLAAARDREALHDRTAVLARQQASLRRVATLVALRADLGEICAAVAAEVAGGIGAEHVSLVRFDGDASCTVLAAQDADVPGAERLAPGERFPIGGDNVSTRVLRTGSAAVIDYDAASGPIAERGRRGGLRTGIGVPVTVEGRTWGAVIIGAVDRVPAPDVEARLTDFADLVATAVHNGETRDQLTRSRARVVAAADQARRSIERDLHDGAQQRIVSLGMDLRATQAAVPAELGELRERLDHSVGALAALHTDLQELSRGIHPAILSRGGLAPALKTLARRSPVPVSLSATLPARLPDPVEVAAYYVVAEALTNTAKHAHASEVTISAVADDAMLRLLVADDGDGGAGTGAGSGLIGLQDRVEAVGGSLTVSSPPGAGTTLDARFPLIPRSLTADTG